MEQMAEVSVSNSKFQVLATDNTVYDTLALLQAAGKTAFPNIDGNRPAHMMLVSRVTGGSTAGAAFYFRTSEDSAPTLGLLALAGVTYSYPGESLTDLIEIRNVWIKSVTASDVINVGVVY